MIGNAIQEEELGQAQAQVGGEVRLGGAVGQAEQDGAQGAAASHLHADQVAQQATVPGVEFEVVSGFVHGAQGRIAAAPQD